MRIVCISDSHCKLKDITIPEGDLLLHAGDLTFIGDIRQVAQEAHQLEKIKHRFTHGIVLTPGNHDWMAERNESLFREMMGSTKVLIDKSVTIEGKKIYGSPWQPEFCNWAFNLPRGQALKDKWSLIPDDTNILITHGPPYKILDLCPDGFRAGCKDLLNRIKELNQLQLHLFGHIHDQYGIQQAEDKTFINASLCTEEYKPTNKPIIIEI